MRAIDLLIPLLRSFKSDHPFYVPHVAFLGMCRGLSSLTNEEFDVAVSYMSSYEGTVVVVEPGSPDLSDNHSNMDDLARGLELFSGADIYFCGEGKRRIEDTIPTNQLHRVKYIRTKLANVRRALSSRRSKSSAEDPEPVLLPVGGDHHLKGFVNVNPNRKGDAYHSFNGSDYFDSCFDGLSVDLIECYAASGFGDFIDFYEGLSPKEIVLHDCDGPDQTPFKSECLSMVEKLHLEDVVDDQFIDVMSSLVDEDVFPRLKYVSWLEIAPGCNFENTIRAYLFRHRPDLALDTFSFDKWKDRCRGGDLSLVPFFSLINGMESFELYVSDFDESHVKI